MTKWHIGFVTNGKRLGSAKVKPTRRWQLVGFPGPGGRESAGIVDLLAIRKTIKPKAPFKRGDLFESILIQIKGGGAKRPDKSEIKRLRDVAKHYNARDVVLAEWVKGNQLKFNWLVNYRADPKKAWGGVAPGGCFAEEEEAEVIRQPRQRSLDVLSFDDTRRLRRSTRSRPACRGDRRYLEAASNSSP